MISTTIHGREVTEEYFSMDSGRVGIRTTVFYEPIQTDLYLFSVGPKQVILSQSSAYWENELHRGISELFEVLSNSDTERGIEYHSNVGITHIASIDPMGNIGQLVATSTITTYMDSPYIKLQLALCDGTSKHATYNLDKHNRTISVLCDSITREIHNDILGFL